MIAGAARSHHTPPADDLPVRRLEGLRVLILIPTFGLGGAERQAFLLARQLAHHEGARVRLVSFSPPDIPLDLTKHCEREGLSWSRFTLVHKKGQRVRQLWDLLRFILFLRRERPDVLLPYCMFPNVVSALTWRFGGVRACVWNQRDEGRSRVARWVERIAVRRIHCFVSNSAHGADFLVEQLGVNRSQVRLVHNGVELPPAKADRNDWRRRLGLPDRAFVAAMVANLHGFKDHQTLIAAWRLVVDRLRDSGRDAHLLLAGQRGDRSEEIERQIAELGVGDHVHVLGSVPDVAGLLGAIDLAVFSSVNEGLPNAVLEAMAAGVAVVATDYPGINEALGAAGLSLLVRSRDAHDLADKIVLAALNPHMRTTAGAAGKARVATVFSVPRMANRMVELIQGELALVAEPEAGRRTD